MSKLNMSELFSEGPMLPLKEDWNDHVVTIVLPHGGGEEPTLKIECKSADNPMSVCTEDICQMKELYRSVGWDAVRAAGDIELARLSARIDWTDPEEPWLDVEP